MSEIWSIKIKNKNNCRIDKKNLVMSFNFNLLYFHLKCGIFRCHNAQWTKCHQVQCPP